MTPDGPMNELFCRERLLSTGYKPRFGFVQRFRLFRRAAGNAAALLLTVLAAAMPFGCTGSGEYDAALEEGLAARARGKLPLAREKLELAVELEPGKPVPRFNLAAVLVEIGAFADAEKHFTWLDEKIGLDSLESVSDRDRVLVDLGAIHLRLAMDKGSTGSFFKAQGYFERALSRDANLYHALLGKALALFGLEKFHEPGGGESAANLLTKCIALEPDRPEPLFFLARCNERDRRLSTVKALELYESVLKVGGAAGPDPGPAVKSKVFRVAIEAVDLAYPLAAIERIVPLMAAIPPADIGLDGAAAREKARARFDLYGKMGGKTPLTQAVADWMAGAASVLGAGSSAQAGTGAQPGPAAAAGLRPSVQILKPSSEGARTSDKTVPVAIAASDDTAGLSLKITVDGNPISPDFRDLKIEAIDFGGRQGERRTMTFDAPLKTGKVRIAVRAVDREGLASDEVTVEVEHRPASVFVVAAGCNGKTDKPLLHAERDASDFMEFINVRRSIPPQNRVLLTGEAATAAGFVSALSDAAARSWDSDEIVAYFAGFGASVESRRGAEQFLAFHGFSPSSPEENGIALAAIGPMFARAAAQRITLIIDAGFGPAGPEGARTWPGLQGPARGWSDAIWNILRIEPRDKARFAIIMASDGAGTAIEMTPENPRMRKGGLLTSMIMDAVRDADSGGRQADSPAAMLGFLAPRLSYLSARAGSSQSPVVLGPEGLPLLK